VRPVLGGTDGAAQPVHEGAVGFMVDRRTPAAGQVAGMSGHVLGQDLGDGRGVVVGGDLGIAGHGVFRRCMPGVKKCYE
jgi:hypothetical protein